jgi:LysR family glycine cleavage system transcriptional activator
MPSRLPPLNPLRAFEAAARHGSVTAAAAELNVTHGAVSHQIKALEAALQVKLTERGGQRLRLTPHGANLLPTLSAAFSDIAAATAMVRRPSTTGELSITGVPALLSFWLIPRLSQFTAQFPGVRLSLAASNEASEIYNPSVDVAILYGDGSWTDCWLKLWSHLNLFPVVSPSLLNARPLRSVRDLTGTAMLHADDGREWHTWLAAADALERTGGPQHYLGDARLAIEAAMHGNGVALGDSLTARSLLSKGVLVMPFDLAVPAVDAFYVACRSEMRSTPIVKVFIDWLFAALEEDHARAEMQPAGQHSLRRRRRE